MGLGKPEVPPTINALLAMISRRAERLDPQQQAQTFVSLGGIEQTLLNSDNRVLFGRRGTGKTHVLSFVADKAKQSGDMAIMLDLRTIGSSTYIYADESISISERATRLLRDFMTAMHDALLDQITAPRNRYDVARLSPLIDELANAAKEVFVRETIEQKHVEGSSVESTFGAQGKAKLSALPSVELKGKNEQQQTVGTTTETTNKGRVRLSVSIGQANRALSEFANRFSKRIWVFIDEWSTLPEVLQPYLADFIKRTFFPNRKYSVHIAAIEHRSSFRGGNGADDIGIELGADAFADINLDDYLVFENQHQGSIEFFKEMLFRHLMAVSPSDDLPVRSADDFLRVAFTQEPAFRELVRACEGVPRDAINILQIAATRAQDEKISVSHIRGSAKDWYDRDKATYVNTNQDADSLLRWIIDRVIGDRKAKAFMVRSDVRNDILERLFDERILHIARKSYSTKQEPGIRYKVWKLDYGCYVDLINTSRAPTGLLFEGADVEPSETIAVPQDDFRAIRRAVLNLDAFYNRQRNESHN
jgi:hypothetical protein